jgi:hypothetical protein
LHDAKTITDTAKNIKLNFFILFSNLMTN